MKILSVEDNEGDQSLLKEAFDRVNPAVEVVFADNADKASAILKEDNKAKDKAGSIKLIMLDLNLPRKKGTDFLKEVKADPMLKRIPVVVLTSSRAARDIAECYDSGASCYLTKPMNFDEFESLIRAFCQFWLKEVWFV